MFSTFHRCELIADCKTWHRACTAIMATIIMLVRSGP